MTIPLLDIDVCDHLADHRCDACRAPCDEDEVEVPPVRHYGFHLDLRLAQVDLL